MMFKTKRVRIKVYGIVQGIGFRPFVSRLAMELSIGGDVCNKGSYVEIHAEGKDDLVNAFIERLSEDAPAVAAIIGKEIWEEEPVGEKNFKIIESVHEPGDIYVSPDLATCPECQKELFDPHNRRYLHPFINCTNCGPRMTILNGMPYDRIRTSMDKFPMCDKCAYEYSHPETRRYHAQPVCCNDDGPTLHLIGREETGKEALIFTRSVIRRGGIAAVKGIGGFHLCCDAKNPKAVKRLRTLKHRPQKPFAVMMKNLSVVKRECVVLDGEEKILTGVQKPILLLKKKLNCTLAESVAPDNPFIGVMLPYAPVQFLLFDYPDDLPMTEAFIMTSGNPHGAPICRTDIEAEKYLSPMCDVILSNNRDILLRADDSVMQFVDKKPYMIRRSRGYAPLPFLGPDLKNNGILAIGGELKNTFVLAKHNLYYPSPYIGDLADPRSIEALDSAITRMKELLEIEPDCVACDLHPGYHSVHYAEKIGLPLIQVQHHYAHILSCMAENRYTEPLIGVSLDGTGYGTDHTIWGGEFLIASTKGFNRIGSLSPFIQAGGDISSKEGWRIAVSIIYDAWNRDKKKTTEIVKSLDLCDEQSLKAQFFMLDKNLNCIPSTSAGRLFDAVSAILDIRKSSTFEGEASMALEFHSELDNRLLAKTEIVAFSSLDYNRERETVGGDLCSRPQDFVLDIKPMIRQIVQKKLNGEKISNIAGQFHNQLALMITAGVDRCSEISGIKTVALSGGCFQNMLLLSLCRKYLENKGYRVLCHSLIPANDGGIALGQAFYAAYKNY